MNKTTGMVKTSHINTRIGHVLAHIQNQVDSFDATDYLTMSEVAAIYQIKGIRGNSEEMDRTELQPIYESKNMYTVYYPHPGKTFDENVANWRNAFHLLIRDAAVNYIILAAKTYEIDKGLEYSTFSIALWDIYVELVRGTAVEQLRSQVYDVING